MYVYFVLISLPRCCMMYYFGYQQCYFIYLLSELLCNEVGVRVNNNNNCMSTAVSIDLWGGGGGGGLIPEADISVEQPATHSMSS